MDYLIDLYILCKARTGKVDKFLNFVHPRRSDHIVVLESREVTLEDAKHRGLSDASFQLSLSGNDSTKFRSFSIHYIKDEAVLYSISIDAARQNEVRGLLKDMLKILDGDFAFAAAETPPATDIEDFYHWVIVAPKPEWIIGDINSLRSI